MRKTIISLTIISTLTLSTSALAKDATITQAQDQAPAIGLGSGILVGAAVAGPVGAVVAGFFGAMLGNDVRQDAQLKAKDHIVDQQAALLNQRHNELLAMRDAIVQLKQDAKVTHVSMQQEEAPLMAVQSNIQFPTGSYAIDKGYQQQLDLIAKALQRFPALQARLTGHADKRGKDSYNQALSMQRAISVKQYLLNKGVDEKQVLTVAVGEDLSTAEKGESTFFDRKVVIDVSESSSTLTAQR